MKEFLKMKKLPHSGVIGMCAAIVLIIFGLLDLLYVVDFGAFHGAAALAAAAVLFAAIATIVLHRWESRTLRFFRKILAVAAVLELTLFQFPSYDMLLGEYAQKTILPSEAILTGDGISYDSVSNTATIIGKNEVVFDFQELGTTVGSVKVNLEFDDYTERIALKMDMCDETTMDMRVNIATNVIVADNPHSEITPCQFSGEVSQLKLKFTGYNDMDKVIIRSFVLNEPVPFQISWFRFAFLSLLGTLCYGIACSGFLKKPYRKAKGFCRTSVLAVAVCGVVIATTIIMTELPEAGLASRFQAEYGDQITQEIVDAFENGQVNLLMEPTEELLAMENPYNWSARTNAGVYYQWDHVFYEGKYYSYYGIAPVLTVFLPFHKLTGFYFQADMAVWIFSCIGLVFLALTYLAAVKRWFYHVPSGCVLAGIIVILSACGIWYSVGRPLFYEISISSGFMFLTMGAYCLISSNLLSKGRISLARTALSSLFIGLAVLSRPTLALYAICAFLFYVCSIVRSGRVWNKKTSSWGTSHARQVLFILCAMLPIGALAVLQMWYNYARFGSIFDFGIQYSLTINDFTHAQFHLIFVFISLFNYLFAAPWLTSDYPYISVPLSRFNVNGYFFSDAGNTSGIFFLALPVFGYLLGGKALRRLPNRRERIRYGAMVGLPCILMPLIIICSVWESGYAVRYTADISWEMILGALAILFFLYTKSKNETKKNLMRGFMSVSAAAAIILNAVHVFYFTFPVNDYPQLCRYLEDIIAFWK